MKNIDERKGEYEFEKVYNSDIKKVMRMPKPVKYKHHALRWTVLFILISLSAIASSIETYLSDEAESAQGDEEINSETLTNG